MSGKRMDMVWLSLSVLSLLAFAVSFLLMPLGEEALNGQISNYAFIAGLMFWISMAVLLVTQCVLAFRRRAWCKTHRNKRASVTQRIGLISFFKNKFAMVADVVMLLSLIGLVVVLILTQGIGYVCYVFVSLFVFSFGMHCILNGKVFYCVKNRDKATQAEEK